ncbi:MAG TPA: hypothetical protein VMV54_09550 [Acidocella sp.]|nr:hypothetical protein [Acidocella sp.]
MGLMIGTRRSLLRRRRAPTELGGDGGVMSAGDLAPELAEADARREKMFPEGDTFGFQQGIGEAQQQV